jgi:hypothetical protein
VSKQQYKNSTGFYILKNLSPFGFHKLCKLCDFQMPFKALGKIIVQGLKQTLKFTNHLQM